MSFGFTEEDSSILAKIEETLARSRRVVLESMELTKKTSLERSVNDKDSQSERESIEIAAPIAERIKELEVSNALLQRELKERDKNYALENEELKKNIQDIKKKHHEQVTFLRERIQKVQEDSDDFEHSKESKTLKKLEDKFKRIRSLYENQLKENRDLQHKIKEIYENQSSNPVSWSIEKQVVENTKRIKAIEEKLKVTHEMYTSFGGKIQGTPKKQLSAKKVKKVQKNQFTSLH